MNPLLERDKGLVGFEIGVYHIGVCENLDEKIIFLDG